MIDINSQLQLLQVKLQQLLKNYQQLQKENGQLKKELTKKSAETNELKEKVQQVEQQIDVLKLSKSGFDETEKVVLEKRIDIYLKEIDKCLALLNN
jgi:prefoldin subunit 5